MININIVITSIVISSNIITDSTYIRHSIIAIAIIYHYDYHRHYDYHYYYY